MCCVDVVGLSLQGSVEVSINTTLLLPLHLNCLVVGNWSS